MSAVLFCKSSALIHLKINCIIVFNAVVSANIDIATQEIIQ